VIPSIHDSLLYAYEVDGDSRTIVLHTRPHQGGGTEFIDVTFRGVLGYDFDGDCLGNIVFGIREAPASEMIGDGVAWRERNRQYGWPEGWNSRKEGPDEFIARCNCRVYELSSSYGMDGFVIAESMELTVCTSAHASDA
jgi:hypothetical protein